jgi:calcium-dependent protein kinase
MGGCVSAGAADGASSSPRGKPIAVVGRGGSGSSAATRAGGSPTGLSDGVYGFDPSVASSSYDFDYAAYASSLLAKGGSLGGSSDSRRRRFRRHRDRAPHTAAASPPPASASPPPAGGSLSGASATSPAFGPRPDLSRPLTNSLLGRDTPDDVAALYTPGRVLGQGQFGVARAAVCVQTGARVAVKTIPKRRLRGIEPGLVDVRREVEVLRHLSGHPRIVRLIDALEDERAVHLVLELCEGGELVDAVAAEGRFTERDAAAALRALLEAVAYCHDLGVAHRDLKLDNLLIGSPSSIASSGSFGRIAAGVAEQQPQKPDDDSNTAGASPDSSSPLPPPPRSSIADLCACIKANDFGLAAFVRDGERVFDLCGTAFYVAPEVLEQGKGRGYDAKAADIWAAGVILYIMLSGTPPFFAERDEDVFRMILQGGDDGRGPSFGDRVWDAVSLPAIECVQRMMHRDPAQRPTAAQLLRDDPWVRVGGVASDDRPLQPEVLRRMRAFARHNRLRREAMLLVAESMPPEEIAGLRALFADLDANGDGLVTPSELREGLLRKGHGAVPREVLERVVALAEIDHEALLSVDEFVASTLDICRAGLRQRLEAAFARFDRDGDGFATRDEVRAALAALQGRRKRREARSRRQTGGANGSASGSAATATGDGEHDDDQDDGQDGGDDDDDELLACELTRAERSILNADVDAVFAEADADGDGRISRDEFFAMMERPLDDAEDDLMAMSGLSQGAVAAALDVGGGGAKGGGRACRDVRGGSGVRGSINRRSLAAAIRAVEQQKQQQQQQQGAAPVLAQ